MVFKLVRIDSPAPLKIDLTLGKHSIGRGNFLHNDESDKRVSRNHAELEVTENSITLKSLHQNPCFYIKRHTTETQLLQQDCFVILTNGDKFGLIPDHFWYEVLQIIDQDAGQNGRSIEHGICNEENAKDADTVSNNVAMEPLNIPIKQEGNMDQTTSPSLLNQLSAQVNETEPAMPTEDIPIKRSADSPDGVTAKKVKTEPDEAGDARPGPSNDQEMSSNDNGGPGNPQKPNNGPLRERCMYGAHCYRRNPQHKAQFSHPADGDWGSGPRGVCPWGVGCRRRQPQHWRDHEHPPAAAPPLYRAHGPQGMRIVQRHGNIYYINAHTVNFYDDHFQAEDSDGDSVDYDYEF